METTIFTQLRNILLNLYAAFLLADAAICGAESVTHMSVLHIVPTVGMTIVSPTGSGGSFVLAYKQISHLIRTRAIQ